MATLPGDPKGWELEDLVAAHFASRGYFVETGVRERRPDEVLELDTVWTDYRVDPPHSAPVEVKSGDWGIGDLFKFHGWTTYLALSPGQFVHKVPNGRVEPATLDHLQARTGIRLLQIATPGDADAKFANLGLRDPALLWLPELWRFSFWAQRRLMHSLKMGIDHGVCPESSKAAKNYHKLVNDAVFFLPEPQLRVTPLLSAHFDHQQLAKSAAYETETGAVNFETPPDTNTFKRAYFNGSHFPVQTCLYLSHRGRLCLLKAVVDNWLSEQQWKVVSPVATSFGALLKTLAPKLTSAMAAGAEELSEAQSFPLLPIFWQTFLWSWGGFLLTDRLDEEYSALSLETGVPLAEVPLALTAFDRFFPTPGGWFRTPSNDTRRCTMLMPAAMRGLGAHRRQLSADVDGYDKLGLKDATAGRMSSDHNTLARLLDCDEAHLSK